MTDYQSGPTVPNAPSMYPDTNPQRNSNLPPNLGPQSVRSGPGAGVALLIIAVFLVIAVLWSVIDRDVPGDTVPVVTEPSAQDAAPADPAAAPAPVVNDTTVTPEATDTAPATEAPATDAPAEAAPVAPANN